MSKKIKIGLINKEEKQIKQEDSATIYGSGSMEVFATPAMIAFMERTAMLCVSNLLPHGFTTVGTHVNVTHNKATPIGRMVYCEVKIVEFDGRKLVFEVIASDEEGDIGSGTHTRFIIDEVKFMNKLKNKI